MALSFIPGGNVDERAYAVMARDIAKAGFLVALVPMPSCLAVYDNEGRADAVIGNYPDIATWAIGGHSLGGVAAGWTITCLPAPTRAKSRVLFCGHPIRCSSASQHKPVKVISIWGTKDALQLRQKINDSKPNLPADTSYIALKGANHTQFGWYGLECNRL